MKIELMMVKCSILSLQFIPSKEILSRNPLGLSTFIWPKKILLEIIKLFCGLKNYVSTSQEPIFQQGVSLTNLLCSKAMESQMFNENPEWKNYFDSWKEKNWWKDEKITWKKQIFGRTKNGKKKLALGGARTRDH